MGALISHFSQSAGKFTGGKELEKALNKDYILYFVGRRSSAVELLNRNQRVGGSNPSAGSEI